ncbi:MAG TPA: GNAT family N-acetyltransferase, partial [Methanomicrobiales archaeon]|nr:GNAT family N-acetyltransferase [Methanomicrobiales archaeon]
EYSIEWYSAADREAFLSLYETAFGKASVDWFKWKYEANPYVDTVPMYVAKKGDELVGASPFFALNLAFGDRQLLALQPADAMVHPDHRRNGLLTRMTKRAIDWYTDNEPAMFFNFPNTQSKGVFLRLGWKVVEELPTHYWIRNPSRLLNGTPDGIIGSGIETVGKQFMRGYLVAKERFAAARDEEISISRHDEIPIAAFTDLYRSHVPEKFHLVRDETFYQWRFDNPQWEYTAYLARRGGIPVAGIITGTKTSSGMTITKIADVLPLSGPKQRPKSLSSLLFTVIKEFHDSDLIAVRDGTIPREVLRGCGFHRDDSFPLSRTTNQTVLVARSLEKNMDVDLYDASNWQFSFVQQDTS